MEKEIWKDIPQYFGYYQASNLGNVRSLERKTKYKDSFRTHKGKKLKSRVSQNGYEIVTISVDNIPKTISVHQLVAMAFLGHTLVDRKMVVDHKDNNKTNNVLSNLHIVSNRYNTSKNKKGTSKYTGVFWHKYAKKWSASIRMENNKKKYLGYFDTEKQAYLAYKTELKRYESTRGFK